MPDSPDFREYVPDSCRDLLEMSDNELKSEIPALARDEGRMGEVEKAVQQLPSHHELYQGDSREVLKELDDESVDLAVTSPPYFNLKDYETPEDGQLGDIDDYERFIDLLDDVWTECERVLRPGGRLCVVVGDVLRSRSEHGGAQCRYFVDDLLHESDAIADAAEAGENSLCGRLRRR